jgi:hypothetical protein
MKTIALSTTLITAALIATTAFAQMGPGMGGGNGPGMGGQGRPVWNEDVTKGWMLMTPQERTEWNARMRAVTTYDECKTLQAEHHQTMEVRAQEKGIKLTPPRHNGCNMMKTRGIFK